MNLTARQRALLEEMKTYALSDAGGKFYRLGGHGCVPLRYDYRTLPRLHDLGLVSRRGFVWEITHDGRAAVFKITQ